MRRTTHITWLWAKDDIHSQQHNKRSSLWC